MILYKKYVKAYRIIDNMYYDMRVRRYFDTSFDIIVSYNNRDFSVLRTLEITTYIRKSGCRPFCSCLFTHPTDIVHCL